MPTVSISYRREDIDLPILENIVAYLESHLGNGQVFVDKHHIRGGDHFPDTIFGAFTESKLILVLIGRNWTGTKPDGSRRISEQGDWVRTEVAMALKLCHRGEVAVLPVLLDGPFMPNKRDLPPSVRVIAELHAPIIKTVGEGEPRSSIKRLVEEDILRLIKLLEEPPAPPSRAWLAFSLSSLVMGLVCSGFGVWFAVQRGWLEAIPPLALGLGLLAGGMWDWLRCKSWRSLCQGA